MARKVRESRMIELTDNAISHIMKNMRYPGEMIRIGVKPAGCAGFEYIIDWTKQYDETDTVCDFGKFQILIDDMSAEYIKGSTLDVIQEGINTFIGNEHQYIINRTGVGIDV